MKPFEANDLLNDSLENANSKHPLDHRNRKAIPDKHLLLFFLIKCIYFNQRLITLQHCIGFAIHQHESTTSTSVSLTMLQLLTMWITTNQKILKEMGIPNHLISLLRSLYTGQEATVRTRHGTVDWFKIVKGE